MCVCVREREREKTEREAREVRRETREERREGEREGRGTLDVYEGDFLVVVSCERLFNCVVAA